MLCWLRRSQWRKVCSIFHFNGASADNRLWPTQPHKKNKTPFWFFAELTSKYNCFILNHASDNDIITANIVIFHKAAFPMLHTLPHPVLNWERLDYIPQRFGHCVFINGCQSTWWLNKAQKDTSSGSFQLNSSSTVRDLQSEFIIKSQFLC